MQVWVFIDFAMDFAFFVHFSLLKFRFLGLAGIGCLDFVRGCILVIFFSKFFSLHQLVQFPANKFQNFNFFKLVFEIVLAGLHL